MIRHRRKTTVCTIKHCYYGALLDVQYTDGSPCEDWPKESCGKRPGVITTYTTKSKSGGEHIAYDSLLPVHTKKDRVNTDPGKMSQSGYGMLKFETNSRIYTFHQLLIPLPSQKCLGLVCGRDFPSLMCDMGTKATVISIPDPQSGSSRTGMSDIFYSEDFYTFHYPYKMSDDEALRRIRTLREEVCDFVRLTSAETIIVRCQDSIPIAYERSAAMWILDWFIEMSRNDVTALREGLPSLVLN